MKFNSNVYDVLKWVVQVVLPALIVAIGTIGNAFGWVHTELTMTILGAITTFGGATLGISSAQYYKNKDVTDNPNKLGK